MPIPNDYETNDQGRNMAGKPKDSKMHTSFSLKYDILN